MDRDREVVAHGLEDSTGQSVEVEHLLGLVALGSHPVTPVPVPVKHGRHSLERMTEVRRGRAPARSPRHRRRSRARVRRP